MSYTVKPKKSVINGALEYIRGSGTHESDSQVMRIVYGFLALIFYQSDGKMASKGMAQWYHKCYINSPKRQPKLKPFFKDFGIENISGCDQYLTLQLSEYQVDLCASKIETNEDHGRPQLLKHLNDLPPPGELSVDELDHLMNLKIQERLEHESLENLVDTSIVLSALPLKESESQKEARPTKLNVKAVEILESADDSFYGDLPENISLNATHCIAAENTIDDFSFSQSFKLGQYMIPGELPVLGGLQDNSSTR